MVASKYLLRHYLQLELNKSLVLSPIMEIHFTYFFQMNFAQSEQNLHHFTRYMICCLLGKCFMSWSSHHLRPVMQASKHLSCLVFRIDFGTICDLRIAKRSQRLDGRFRSGVGNGFGSSLEVELNSLSLVGRSIFLGGKCSHRLLVLLAGIS